MENKNHVREVRLNRADRAMLHALKIAVDAIAMAFGSHCEVVLHSFEDLSHSVIKIANSHVSGRSIGSPITDRVLEILHSRDSTDSDVFCYYTKLAGGRPAKTATALIRNPDSKVIGVLCINIDLSSPVIEFFKEFVPVPEDLPDAVVEHFPLTVRELVRHMLETATANASKRGRLSPTERTKRVIWELYRRGAFDVKGGLDLVAKEMGVSRYTVYNYIREAKIAEEEHV